MNKAAKEKVAGSFRDPAGYLFEQGGELYRQINKSYLSDYRQLRDSGLYEELVEEKLVISHEETRNIEPSMPDGHLIIKPERIPFVSYPYEWSFSQYKDAALTTLEIQRRALAKGMSLKDASAYNIQLYQGQPLLIDTLSFEIYEEGKPWVAYKQFCQHFLGPLALMTYTDVDLSKLMKIYIDGVPLPMASKLLPKRTWANSLAAHIHFHARSQKKYAHGQGRVRSVKMSRSALTGLITNLANVINKLDWKSTKTEWGDYYTFTNYSDKSFDQKKKIVSNFIKQVKPKSVWDLGANDGPFSRLASDKGIPTVSFDIDPIAVEKNYRRVKRNKETNILPLILDLTNPSAPIGWANEERLSLAERGPADLVMALALVHHLAISNNVPLAEIASYFSNLGEYLIIEFVSKEDSKVKKLLTTRRDIFDNYNPEGFEQAFAIHFKILKRSPVSGTKRTLYLMRAK